MKEKVAELTANATSPLAKIRSIAKFMQTDMRYVAIEFKHRLYMQPHSAATSLVIGTGDTARTTPHY